MREIKFTTNYEPVLSFSDKNFKTKYEERVGNNPAYIQMVDGDMKHLALCPRCNNPVVILGVYKKINIAPHARHKKNINIPNVADYNEYTYEHCPYHRKKSNYVKEYVPETDEPQRKELYKIAKKNFDKAIYLLQKETGIQINTKMADELAENYVKMRAYNYIDATIYNIPWYLLYSFPGFPLYHMKVRKNTTLHKRLKKLGIKLSNIGEKYAYVEDNGGYLLRATNYRYMVDKDDTLKEYLDFSILCPDKNVNDTLLYIPEDRFSLNIDSYYFSNLVHFEHWHPRQDLLDIAGKYMDP